jgi:hypothetical protein
VHRADLRGRGNSVAPIDAVAVMGWVGAVNALCGAITARIPDARRALTHSHSRRT